MSQPIPTPFTTFLNSSFPAPGVFSVTPNPQEDTYCNFRNKERAYMEKVITLIPTTKREVSETYI
jgi:hypothetical protein